MIRIAVSFALFTNLTRFPLSIKKSLAKITQAAQTFSAKIGYLYFPDSTYVHVINGGTIKAGTNDLGLASYSVDVGVVFTFSMKSIFVKFQKRKHYFNSNYLFVDCIELLC